MADLDGDGDIDAVSASEGDDTISWHENFPVPELGLESSWPTHTISSSALGAWSVDVAPPTYFLVALWETDAESAVPDDLTITHVTSASSTGDDATYDIPLLLEGEPDVTTGPIEINDPPVAFDDGPYGIGEGGGTISPPGSVLDNDTDEEDTGSLTAILESGPSHAASFTLESDGTFTYTPTGPFPGEDSFTYRADDGFELSEPATVTIVVDGIFADGFESGDSSAWSSAVP